MKKVICSLLVAPFIFGCAGGLATSNYSPVVDIAATAANKRLPEMEAHQQYRSDLAYCQGLASQRSVITAGGQSGAVGAVVGAGTGALAGVVAGGSAGAGALIGAAGGALASFTYGGLQGNQAKQDITMTCLRGRGWEVLAR